MATTKRAVNETGTIDIGTLAELLHETEQHHECGSGMPHT
jgi:hypothetical protein